MNRIFKEAFTNALYMGKNGSILVGCFLLLFVGNVIGAAPVISNLSNFQYDENEGVIQVDSDVSLSNGGTYNDGYLKFAISTNSSQYDQFSYTSSPNPLDVGEISFVNGIVYEGTGGDREPIGAIDDTENGINGQPLKVNFSSPLTNAGFETGDMTGWTATEAHYGTSLNGTSIPYSYSGGTGTANIVCASTSGTMNYDVTIDRSTVFSGDYALRLLLKGRINLDSQTPSGSGTQPDGYGSSHGPSVISEPFSAENGDQLSLEWSAQNGGDWYEVFGFVEASGGDGTFGDGNETTTLLFSQRGDAQSWTNKKLNIPSTDTYRFKFVGGTYDASGGYVVGGSLYIDNVRLVSSQGIADATLSAIAQRVTYENSSEDPGDADRTLVVTALNSIGESGSANCTIDFINTDLNDAPVVTDGNPYHVALEDVLNGAGGAVSTVLGKSATTVINDPDNILPPLDDEGIAVIAVTGNNGTWQYSTDGGSSWNTFGSPSVNAARLLASTSRLRYNYNTANSYGDGVDQLTFHAWDGTDGSTVGTTGDVTTNGGTTAFSTNTDVIQVNVTAVNDVPSFTKGTDQIAIKNTGAQTVNGWATSLSTGPANESAQTLSFIVSTNNNSLFSASPAIDASGNLTYTPATNAAGTAEVTVSIKDNGGTANNGVDQSASQTFNITVTPKGYWVGVTSTDWHTGSNWAGGIVPTASDSVFIRPSSNPAVTYQPTISSNATCQNLTLENGATITINANNTLAITGDFTDKGGDFNIATGGAVTIPTSKAIKNESGVSKLSITGGGGLIIKGDIDVEQLGSRE